MAYREQFELHDRLRHNIWAAAHLHYAGGSVGRPLVVEGLEGRTYDDVFKPFDVTPSPSGESMPRSIWFCEMRYKGSLRQDATELVVPLYTPSAQIGGLVVEWGLWPKKLKEVFSSLFVEAVKVAERRFRARETRPAVYFITSVGQAPGPVVDDYRKLCVVW